MSLGDIPKIPPKYKPRISKLFKKVKAGETTLGEVGKNVLAAAGKVTFDSNGLKIAGDYGAFEFDKRLLDGLEEALVIATDALPAMMKKKVCLIKKGLNITKFTLGPTGMWHTLAKPEDLQNKSLPIIEIVGDPKERFAKQVMNAIHTYLQSPLDEWEQVPRAINIHRLEEFGSWMGDDWQTAGILTEAMASLTDLTAKEVLDKLHEPMDRFCDHALKKCGV